MKTDRPNVLISRPARLAGYVFTITVILSLLAANLSAQRSRITGKVDNRRRVALRGHLHPKAELQYDQGPVDPALPLPYVTLLLKRSASQESDLNQLLADQQDSSSSNYHHWLTPEEYANRFGVSQEDINKITSWLQDQGLHVVSVARARNWVAFSGDAAQVESAFGARIHHYLVDGKMHFANATEPSIPEAFEAVVTGIHGLNDFRLKSPKRSVQPLPPQPAYTSSRGSHYLAPDDVATIYNIKPLYNAGINGSGQSLVVVGQTKINISDIQQFRSNFNLPANDPQIVQVPDTANPRVNSDELAEADLDLELSGAVARNATVIYVYSDDVTVSAQYAIDQNLAPVISMSYGFCEVQTPRSDAMGLQASARQANAQGITWFAASGDSGATDCDGSGSRTTGALSVDLPAGLPEVTGVGGTEFNEAGGNFWNTATDGNGASVLSYIQETAWNDTTPGNLSATGGGASIFFAKPSWQTGAGVPNDGARDVPDVSLASSSSHDGFMIYTGGNLGIVGGTSVAAPTFAGIAALLNQYVVSTGSQSAAGLGNINPRLYSLAQTAPNAFHDVTTGNNIINVTCGTRSSRNCTPGSFGFSSGAGYDQVTGLGSVDAYNFVTAWVPAGAAPQATPAMQLVSSANTITVADSATLTVTVAGANGGTPSGTVTFYQGASLLGAAALQGSGGRATATLTVNGWLLTAGDTAISAQYSGDSAYGGATASVTITVSSATLGPPAISSLANGASFRQAYAPGMILSVFGSQLAPATQTAGSVPLPAQLAGVSATVNGIVAPLFYVSPGQLNLQIPYQTPVNSIAVLNITNNGQTASISFAVADAAPGIFTDSAGAPAPNTSATRGQVVTLFITGAGAVGPAVATGASPAAGTAAGDLPKPAQAVTVTVGGVQAPVQFAGITPGLAGVMQINYQVPDGAAIGEQPVVVAIGNASSPPARLQITQ